jgi:hypothetical protein
MYPRGLTLTVLRYAQKTYFENFSFGGSGFFLQIFVLPQLSPKNRSLLKVLFAAKGGV